MENGSKTWDTSVLLSPSYDTSARHQHDQENYTCFESSYGKFIWKKGLFFNQMLDAQRSEGMVSA